MASRPSFSTKIREIFLNKNEGTHQEIHTEKWQNYANTNKQKKGINNYQFYIGTNKQASEYEAAAEFLINYIKRTFDCRNNIAKTLRTLQKQETDNWKPILKKSNADEQEIIAAENKQFK